MISRYERAFILNLHENIHVCSNGISAISMTRIFFCIYFVLFSLVYFTASLYCQLLLRTFYSAFLFMASIFPLFSFDLRISHLHFFGVKIFARVPDSMWQVDIEQAMTLFNALYKMPNTTESPRWISTCIFSFARKQIIAKAFSWEKNRQCWW